MADYGKKVVYLSCLEDGNKVKNAGFLKIRKETERCGMDMHISALKEVKNGKYDICAIGFGGSEFVLGNIYLHMGKGEWKAAFPCEIEQPGEICLKYEDIECFKVKISTSKWLEGSTGNVLKTNFTEKKAVYENGSVKTRKGNEKVKEIKTEIKAELKAGWIEERVNPEMVSEFKLKNEIDMENIILNDKWEQLCQIYPVIHPYEDDRQYISIQPKDFVIMTGDYQHLANNSFLLHGFYNYRYIILGNEKDEGGFYLGVPGVYYEREKMVALMFGFEAFECSGGKAEAGKFGYYLRKVGI